jgi:hypothetical protein
MGDLENKDQRKVTDIISSLEDKVVLLIKTIAANDMNNKLILDRLNKLLNQSSTPSAAPDSKPAPQAPKVASPVATQPIIEVSKEPVRFRKQPPPAPSVSDKKESKSGDSSQGKVPVGQRVTDNTGKDLFMADVQITNLETDELIKVKTNAVGKWQSYLGVGNYSVHISKVIDSNTLAKLESLQEIEVTPQMKSLQLPIIIIKR